MSQLWPFLVIGLLSGSVYALAAMGLVLTYRTAGVFNFAYGAKAMFCAFTFWQLRDGWHVPTWISLPLVLVVVAPAMGLAFERIMAPLRAVSAEVQIVVSLGLLAFLQALVPLLYGGQDRSLPSILPTSTFGVGSLRVGYDQLGTLLITAAVGGGLWLLLRRTGFGLAARAVVDNRDLAELNGIGADGVARVSWMLSSAFAALAGILLSASQGLDVYVLVVVVIYAFAPAVLGRLVSLPLAFAGGLGLGVAQGVLGRWGSSGTVADVETAIPYIALFALLVGYGGRLKESGRDFAPLVHRGPVLGASTGRAFAWLAGLGAVGLLAPAVLGASLVDDLTYGIVFACIALTLVVLTGWAGQISLAQFSFVGIGAVVAGHLAGPTGSWFFPVMVLGGLVAVPIGLLVGLPSLRLSGLFLALATMAFALLMDDLVFARSDVSGGYTGMTVPRPAVGGWRLQSTTAFYYLALAVLVLFAATCIVIRHGRLGRRLEALRQSPVAASTLGVNVVATKLAVFALCAFGAGVAGALYGALRRTVSPSDFSFSSSLQLLLLVVIGGRSLVAGAVVAGGLFATELLPSTGATGRYLPLGVAAAVVVVARYPEGILSFLGDRLGGMTALLRRLPAGRWGYGDDGDVPAAAGPSGAAIAPAVPSAVGTVSP
ncbi:MAG TPA: ABC transporter permease [Acidimicrobiales bacterium]|nr:ABC transporter permease [Acidimicrobiales bacterium]